MFGRATFCIKVVPSQAKPYFSYIDAASEEEALHLALVKVHQESEDNGRDSTDDFAQVGIFFTDHMLHQLAKGMYLT